MRETLKENINKVVQITNDEFLEIESYFEKQTLKKGKFLVETGKAVTQDFFILSGLAVASHLDERGKNHIVQFAMEGQWISDIESFNTGSSSTIDIKCLEDTELYYISYTDMENLCLLSKKAEYFFRKKSNVNSILLQKRILLFMCADSKGRYKQFINQYPKIQFRVPKVLIASYLGITRETLNQM